LNSVLTDLLGTGNSKPVGGGGIKIKVHKTGTEDSNGSTVSTDSSESNNSGAAAAEVVSPTDTSALFNDIMNS
jgi:hypothetical protein